MAQCPKCNGRGGFMGPYGWVKCSCLKPTKEQRKLIRRMNSIGAKNQTPLFPREKSDTQTSLFSKPPPEFPG